MTHLLLQPGLGSVWQTLGFMMDELPFVFACPGISLNELFGVVNDFTAGAGATSLSDSTFRNETKREISLLTQEDFCQSSSLTLPLVVLGENEVLVRLFFLLSLSSKDTNSSSELPDSCRAAGIENVRLGDTANS